MKYFICSDIHGNIRALEAVLAVYREHLPCSFLCLGDCIGYGPQSDACLESILDLPDSHFIMGNHEWAFLNRKERIHLHVLAADALNRSDKSLHGKFDKPIREGFRMKLNLDGLLAVHSSPDHPEDWPYIFTIIDAYGAFEKTDFDKCFIGHTHIPSIFTMQEGMKIFREGESVSLDRTDRYIINPGSVGQPRDRDPRAACCIFDSNEGSIAFFRCNYDVEAEFQDFLEAGFPPYLGERLLYGA